MPKFSAGKEHQETLQYVQNKFFIIILEDASFTRVVDGLLSTSNRVSG
jgi:hypothetical protein